MTGFFRWYSRHVGVHFQRVALELMIPQFGGVSIPTQTFWTVYYGRSRLDARQLAVSVEFMMAGARALLKEDFGRAARHSRADVLLFDDLETAAAVVSRLCKREWRSPYLPNTIMEPDVVLARLRPARELPGALTGGLFELTLARHGTADQTETWIGVGYRQSLLYRLAGHDEWPPCRSALRCAEAEELLNCIRCDGVPDAERPERWALYGALILYCLEHRKEHPQLWTSIRDRLTNTGAPLDVGERLLNHFGKTPAAQLDALCSWAEQRYGRPDD
ncbi:MAG: hypothetical protein IPM64_11765 [Phycisphaerales bacterium]|nr:hypothetical protein [Phycisphaerales bacterium]